LPGRPHDTAAGSGRPALGIARSQRLGLAQVGGLAGAVGFVSAIYWVFAPDFAVNAGGLSEGQSAWATINLERTCTSPTTPRSSIQPRHQFLIQIVAQALKPIYCAASAEAAEERLQAFEAAWGERYPSSGEAWRRNWDQVVPFLAFPPDIRQVIYTTNAIESLHRTVRKTIKTRGSFPNDEAALKLIYS
jgi:hypothetical protein